MSPTAAGSWAQIGAELRMALPAVELAAAESATPTSYFTDPRLSPVLWKIATGVGFTGGRVLETGCGSGAFMAAAPADLRLRWTGVERDPTSARIAQARFPGAQIIASPLELVPLPAGVFDLAIGNVPFADVQIYDKDAPKLNLHNYCLWRSLQAVHPGGYVIALTSRYTMDAASPGQRAELAALGDLVGAIRLPSGALGEAGTRAIADIVVLRRRGEHEPQRGANWLEVAPFSVVDSGFGGETSVNEYFAEHRDHILGTPTINRGLYRPELVIRSSGHLVEDLARSSDAVVSVANEQGLRHSGRGRTDIDDVVLADRDGRKEGSFHLIGNGVKQVRDGRLHSVDATSAELRALIGLRDAVIAMIDAESDLDASDAVLAPLRRTLNIRYDTYVAKYGPLNRATIVEGKPDPETGMATLSRRRPRMGGFRQDPDYVTVLALELYDDATGQAEKAPIFDRRVLRRAVHPEHADSPAEALAYCLNEHGHLDVATVARLLGVTEQEAPRLLGDLAYCDPETNQWTTAPEYLSGDVRAKLQIAQAAANRAPTRWRRNVDALTAVVPRDLAPHEIRVRLGAPWIPAADVARFCGEVLEATPVITHESLTASWTVKANAWQMNSPAATIEWGTARVNAFRIVELALNGSTPVVYDTVTLPDGNTARVKNVAETIAAVEKRQALNARFAEWLWEDPERTDRLTELYNRRYNAIVPQKFDGSHLSFDGLADGWSPYPWQRDIVWRNVSSPSALCGHDVGSGKTLSMVATAMTLRRLGLATKPMIITPGHLLEQVARDAKRLYPGAKVLMVTKEDLTPERRKLFAARCATGDWDLVVMTHSGFGLLPVSSATEDAFLEDQIAAYRQALGSEDERSITVKNLNKALDRMRQRQAELRDKRHDDGVSFEQLGVDYLMVDEAHLFKSLPVPSRMTGFSLPESKRAIDLALKLKWIRERNDGARWGAFFTGTPVSNTLAELYILQLYLNPDRLAELGLTSFDAWAAQFVDWVTKVEVAPDGGSYRMHTRPARFMNTPELRRLFSEFADVRPKEAFTTGAPKLKVSIVTVEPTEGQQWFVDQLVRRADALRSGVPERPDPNRPSLEDNMLWVCGDGRKAALDLELVGYPAGRPPKVEAVAREILNRWLPSLDHPDGPNFQIIFCDLGTPKEKGGSGVYGKIRSTLIEAGMPPSMIRFVHSAKTDAARAQLFADCRSGKVAALIGSTPKLGTGVNVQERCRAIHHLDAPWKPAEVEQRDGRGPRPGNRHDEVDSLRYITPGTFDAYSWETLLRKFIVVTQLLVGEGDAREIEDLGDGVLTYAEARAAATGDPLILELTAVQSEISRLRGLATSHTRMQRRAGYDADADREGASAAAHRAEVLTAIADTAARSTPGWASPHGERFAETTRITEQMAGLIGAALTTGMPSVRLGTWSGVPVTAAISEPDQDGPLVVTLTIGETSRVSGVTLRLPVSILAPSHRWRLARDIADVVSQAGDRA